MVTTRLLITKMYNQKGYFVSRILVLCLLIIPVILKEGPLRLEPYPAVILPGGGGPSKQLGSEFSIHHELRLYMLMEDAEVKVNHTQFFRPFAWYAKYIMRNNFGLGSLPPPTDSLTTTRREGIKWIKGRLNKLTGIDEEEIKGLKYEKCRLKIYYDAKRPNKERCKTKSVILF